MLKKTNFKIRDTYVFLGDTRYRVSIPGTNIVFNVKASDEEEAIEKAYNMALKMGLTDEIIEDIRKKTKALQK